MMLNDEVRPTVIDTFIIQDLSFVNYERTASLFLFMRRYSFILKISFEHIGIDHSRANHDQISKLKLL